MGIGIDGRFGFESRRGVTVHDKRKHLGPFSSTLNYLKVNFIPSCFYTSVAWRKCKIRTLYS